MEVSPARRCFRSAVYFHHGFAALPPVNRTTAMNVSSMHGSCRWPVILHRTSYNTYGSRPIKCFGLEMPRRRRSPATAGPTFGSCSNSVNSVRLALALGRVFVFITDDVPVFHNSTRPHDVCPYHGKPRECEVMTAKKDEDREDRRLASSGKGLEPKASE